MRQLTNFELFYVGNFFLIATINFFLLLVVSDLPTAITVFTVLLLVFLWSFSCFKKIISDPLLDLWQILINFSETDDRLFRINQLHAIIEKIIIDLMLKNRRINEESKYRSEFFANMSHEIRTPMTAIIGMADLALHYNKDEKVDDFLQKITRSSKSLLQIINDILDFSKINSGKMNLRNADFNLCETIEHVVSMFGEKMREKPLEFIINIDQCGLILKGDQLRIEQVLFNLIGNAFKFTDEGEVEVEITTKIVNNFASISFQVRDTGIGIDSVKCVQLFEPFHQIDESFTRRFGGTGLGLTISNMFVKLMGSEIKVTSKLLEGSNFYFDLLLPYVSKIVKIPLDLRVLVMDQNQNAREAICTMLDLFGVDSHDVGSKDSLNFNLKMFSYNLVIINYTPGLDVAEVSKSHKVLLIVNPYYSCKVKDVKILYKPIFSTNLYSAVSELCGIKQNNVKKDHEAFDLLSGLKILVVEDNYINQQVIVEILKIAGVHVTLAVNGQDALDKFNDSFDCILMDIQMPVMDGYTTTTILKNRGVKIPIFAMTAHTRDEDVQMSLQYGMVKHITKPITKLNLYRVLTKYLKGDEVEGAQKEVQTNLAFDFIDVIGPLQQVDETVYLNMLKSFVREFEPYLLKVLDAEYVHTVKGAAGNIGAMKLFKKCEDSIDISNELKEVIDEIKSKLPIVVDTSLSDAFNMLDLITIRSFCKTDTQIRLLTEIELGIEVENNLNELKIEFNL